MLLLYQCKQEAESVRYFKNKPLRAEVKAVQFFNISEQQNFTVYTSLEVGKDLHSTIKIYQLTIMNPARLVTLSYWTQDQLPSIKLKGENNNG